jgi:ABC-type phosphate/phosphonate transport system substrate-binding protein
MLRRSLLALSLSALSFSAFAANYTLSVEPNYPASQAQEIYKPLLTYLSKATGHKFTLKTANNYHAYWRDILNNSPTDFTFEEAPYADFRAQYFKYTPLVKVAENTQFSLLVSPENKAGGTGDLFSGTIVSMPSPSLSYLFLNELYPNPIAQPEITSSALTWKDGVDIVFAQEAKAAMVPTYIAAQYPNLESVYLSRSLPGRSINAAKTVPADVRKAVSNAMLNLHKNAALNDVLTELGTAQFVPASAAQIRGNEKMLNRVFGYPKSAAKKPVATTTAAPAKTPAAKPAVKK